MVGARLETPKRIKTSQRKGYIKDDKQRTLDFPAVGLGSFSFETWSMYLFHLGQFPSCFWSIWR